MDAPAGRDDNTSRVAVVLSPTSTPAAAMSRVRLSIAVCHSPRVGRRLIRFICPPRLSPFKPVQADRFGRLYRLDPHWTEPIALVEVLNSTPEPNGSRRRYFLYVPPTVRTAHQAVAWTFGLGPKEYRPDMES
jgi:hypothetical protein